MAQKVAILGSLGMLGQALTDLFRHDPGYDVVAWDKDDIDVTDSQLRSVQCSRSL
jgi:dTDP-4-dehydrorhamnose reductase